MNTDLLRERQKWIEQVQDMRKIMDNLLNEGYAENHMKSWRAFWDRQLYKALDLQYTIGLRAFNENLPDINIDLSFGENAIQFKLPNSSETSTSIGTIKNAYYREMKTFITFPFTFDGCGGSSSKRRLIFENIMSRHNEDIAVCYYSSIDLFKRFGDNLKQFHEWTILGQVEIGELVDQYLIDVSDWEKNFRILKLRGQDVEKLPNEIRVDCFLLNLIPLKTTIENQIQRLQESMFTYLKRSISRDAATIESFVNEGVETLSDRPRTHEELGLSYKKHDQLNIKRQEIIPLYERLESKNKLLRSVAGGGHDQLVQLQLKLDKFESMMDSHVQMIGEQKDVLKRNLKARYETFVNDCEKMRSKWKQLKPREQDMEDESKCRDALKIVREREKEIQDMVKQKEKMM